MQINELLQSTCIKTFDVASKLLRRIKPPLNVGYQEGTMDYRHASVL